MNRFKKFDTMNGDFQLRKNTLSNYLIWVKGIMITLFFLFINNMSFGQLNEYLQEAAEHNPGLQAQFNRYYADLQKVPQVGALPDPKASLSYAILPTETRVGERVMGIELSQSFPWFGTLAAKKDAASQQAEVSYQEFLKVKNELFYEVKSAYYQLYVTQKSINTTRRYLDILKRDEKVSLSRIEGGEGSMVDVLQVQMEAKERQAQLEMLLDIQQTQSARFNTLLNHSVNEKVEVQDSLVSAELVWDDQVLMDSILLKNPELNALYQRNTALNSQKVIAQKEGQPSFGVGVSYGLVTPRTDMDVPQNGQDILMPMATLSIPIYRKKYKAKISEVDYMQQSLQQEIEQKKNSLEAQLVQAINQYKDADRKRLLYAELLVQSRQASNIITQAYAGGEGSYEKVLDIEQQVLRYELALDKAGADLQIAIALLEKLWAKNIDTDHANK
ncbi:TolC family protein [Fulvivirga sediminis]|uniref:TolC family protein n=1 Tax=Fulvivirga sediminis TaxID=2803949 RepID=A0A937K147_9BACT|nr:TolC family protein [Fulvivirga sediminis]MBL3656277.1 TolC family protein [Fulvivirga sediminis]